MAELRRLQDMEIYLSATDYSSPAVQHSPGRGPTETLALGSNLEQLEDQIRSELETLIRAKLQAVRLISLLDDKRMTEALWEYYIHSLRTWDDVADAMGYSRQHVTKLHGQALEKLKEKMRLNASSGIW